MKPQAKITAAEKLIQNGMRELRTCAEAAADSARNLVNLALAHRRKLMSDATIVNEIAMLLQHASQNLQYTIQQNHTYEANDTRTRRTSSRALPKKLSRPHTTSAGSRGRRVPPNAAVGKEGPAERPPHLAKSLLESKIHRGSTLRTSVPFPQALPSAQ